MFAVYFLVIVYSGWMFWQARAHHPFDPYPFAFLLFCSNLVQIVLMSLIMVGQNVQARHAELQAQHDYDIDVMSESELRLMQSKLDRVIAALDAQGGQSS